MSSFVLRRHAVCQKSLGLWSVSFSSKLTRQSIVSVIAAASRSHCVRHKLRSTHFQLKWFGSSAPHRIRQTNCLKSAKTSRNSASISQTAVHEVKESPAAEGHSLFRQRFVYVQTSRDRWEDIPGGVFFDVAYLDSSPDSKVSTGVPLVVSLHNTPGTFSDLQPVLESFVKAGCRVLCPAFPGIGLTEGVTKGYNDIFTHSTSEKAEFIRDFLVNLGVEKVDLLIGHGSGCYPVMRLASGPDTASMFRSVSLLSPWPHRQFKGTRQRNLLPLLHDMWERPFYRPIARVLSKCFSNTSNTTALQRVAMIYTLYNVDFGEVGGFSVALDAKKVPRVMLFAEDDDFVDAKLSYELADLMGIDTDNMHHFNTHLHKGEMEKFPSCLVFKNGGQNPHRTYPGVTTAVLFNLLKTVRPGFAV